MKAVYFIIYLLVIPVITSYGQSDKELIKKGNEEYKNKNFNKSEIDYRKALEKNKESTEGIFNLGDALYKQEKYEEASTQFQEIISKTTNDDIKAKAYHNLGNSLLKSKKFEESIEAYKNALKRSPGDEESKYNLAYARAMIRKEQQNKENKNNKDKNKKDENKDNKNDQDKKDKDKNEQDKKDKDKKDQDKKDKEKKDKEEEDNKDKSDKDKKEDQGQKPDPNKLSKEDAQRILDALNNKEKDLQKKATKKQGTRVTIEKNW